MRRHAIRNRRLFRGAIIVLLFILFIFLLWSAVGYVERKIYPIQYEETVYAMAEEFELAPSLVFAVIHTESKFDESAVSSADAKGLMQITDATFRWAQRRAGEKRVSSDQLFVPETNIKYGCYILVLLSEQFSNTETVLAAYNAGQGRVKQWLQDSAYSNDGKTLHTIPYQETEDYVRRVLSTQKRYQQIYNIP